MIPPLSQDSNHQSQHFEILVFVQALILALFIYAQYFRLACIVIFKQLCKREYIPD